MSRRFEVPVAYENGWVNDVKLGPLGPGRRSDARMMGLGFNGQLIHQHPVDNKPSQLVVLPSAPGAGPATEARSARTFEEFHVRFAPYARADEFATEVETTAHAT